MTEGFGREKAMSDRGEIYRSVPIDVRERYEFFIVYRPDANIPAVQLQFDDGQTYDLMVDEFERNPQISRLPLWDRVLRLACAEGQAVYVFGDDPSKDTVKSVPTERKKNAPINVTTRLRENAVSFTRKARIKRGAAYLGPRRYPKM